MSIIERFRPKTMRDLVGNKKPIEQFLQSVKKGRVTLLHGSAGIGKTSTVFAYANDYGYRVREVNASDERNREEMKKVVREVSTETFLPTLFLLDEIDGVENFKGIEDCIKNTVNPLVLICNDLYEIPDSVTKLCDVIKFSDLQSADVTEIVRRIAEKTGLNPDYTRASKDARNSILACFFGGDKYDTSTNFDIIDDFFKHQKIDQLDNDLVIWLLDNGTEMLHGRNLYNFLGMLDVSVRIGSFQPLTLTKPSYGRISYPRYLQKLKMYRSKTKE